MRINTKHISTAVVLAILSFGIFALTIEHISSDGKVLYGHPLTLLISGLSLFAGLVFVYFAKWMRDTENFKQNLK